MLFHSVIGINSATYFECVICMNHVISLNSEMKRKMMTTQEACDALGISLSTLRRRVRAGELKPIPKALGQKRAYRLELLYADIERLLKGAEA